MAAYFAIAVEVVSVITVFLFLMVISIKKKDEHRCSSFFNSNQNQ